MDDEFSGFGKPKLVTDNRGEPLFVRSVAACRKRRQISVHREWNDHAEWWVGHVFADREVHRIGVFTSPERAFAGTISYYYEIVAKLEREDRLAEEQAVAAAAAAAKAHRAPARAGQPDSDRDPVVDAERDEESEGSRAARRGAPSGEARPSTTRT